MKIKKQQIILFFSTFGSFLISVFLWDKIYLKYSDPGIVGIYSENNYNSLNDFIRYLIVIILPTLAYLITKFYTDKKFLEKIKFFFENSKELEITKNSKILIIIFSISIILFLLEFFSINFPYHNLDSYHEGQRISSAYKNLTDKSLWSGSFVTVGIFYETLSSTLIWRLIDHISIGSARYIELVYVLILKSLLIIFIYNLIPFLRLTNFYKSIFFVFNIIIINGLTDYNLNTVDLLSFREIPVIILAIFFLLSLKFSNNFIILFLISSVSVLSMLWGIDRGLICNLLILVILVYFLLLKDKKSFLSLFFLILINWICLYFYLGGEFQFFLENTLSIYKNMNYIHGLIHPNLFSSDPDSSRATKTIVSILITLIISLIIIFQNNRNFNNQLKRSLFFLSLICVMSYVYALGRSDGPHIRHTFGYPLLTLSIFFSYYLCIFFEKKKNLMKFVSSLSLIFILLINNKIDVDNLINYQIRLKELLFKEDYFFLNEEEKKFVKEAKPLLKEYDCIQLFSNDAALYYLLRKKSCTKYYYVWSASPKKIQLDLIKQMSQTIIIIKGGKNNYWDISLEKKLFLVDKYINKNFSNKYKIYDWYIYKKG